MVPAPLTVRRKPLFVTVERVRVLVSEATVEPLPSVIVPLQVLLPFVFWRAPLAEMPEPLSVSASDPTVMPPPI